MPIELFEGEMTTENLKNYWNDLAKKYGTDPSLTIRDIWFKRLTMEEMRKWLSKDDFVLDVGCGNGHQTLFYAQFVDRIVGIDFAEKLIEAANKNPKNNVKFIVGDITKINQPDNEFDKVVVERTLINLPSRELQSKAMAELHRVCKPNGLVLMVEVTQQGHDKIDFYRKMFGLQQIQKHKNNLYLDENIFLDEVKKYFDVVEIKRFGMYQFISKVLHPLYVKPEEPKFDSSFNQLAYEIGKKITDFDGCSHQVMFVLKKRQ